MKWFRRFFHDSAILRGGPAVRRRQREASVSTESLEERLLLYALGTRWTTTAQSGPGLVQGDPAVVTWRLVDDGTQIRANDSVPEEADGPSNLVAWLGSVHGVQTADTNYTDEPWFPFFADVFDRWGAISGLTFVYESNDDGAPIQTPGSSFPGVDGVRADIRIGGHAIDGTSGALAYAYQPGSGEIVLDTTDAILATASNNFANLRQTLSHEVGHALGLNHMVSTSHEFLMEGALNTSFDGPQYDDILAIQRWYGDAFESGQNDTTGSPTPLGLLARGQSITVGADGATVQQQIGNNDIVSIDDESDVDVYSFTVDFADEISLQLTPIGPAYLAGNVGGSQSTFDAAAQSDLRLELITGDGSTVLASANLTGIGGIESITDYPISTTGQYFVRVTGLTHNAIQTYQLLLTGPKLPTLTVSLSNDTISEAAGNSAAVGTVTRTGGDLSTALVVNLSGNDASEATLPASVTIPANLAAATFLINAIDDNVPDGDQVVTLTATASGYVTGTTVLNVTDNDVPAPPTITGPAAVVSSQRPAITWTSSPTAETYNLWIANQSTGANPYYTLTVARNSWTPNFDLGIGLFNIWVRAANANGKSSYSTQHNVRINTAVTTHAMDLQQTTHRPTLSWESLPGADRYDVWIDDHLGGVRQFIRNSYVTGTSFTPSFDMSLGVYRAWVRGIDAGGVGAAWSQRIEFQVVAPPTITGGDNPTFDRTPTFSWMSSAGAATYEVFVRDRNSGQTVIYEQGLTGTSFTPVTALPDGPYRWWALAASANGVRSLWTAPMDIYVGGRTDVLTPVGTTPDTTPTISWRTVDQAVRYELHVDRIGYGSGYLRENNLTSTSYTPGYPLPKGEYRVWVRAVSDTSEDSPWSLPLSFTVVDNDGPFDNSCGTLCASPLTPYLQKEWERGAGWYAESNNELLYEMRHAGSSNTEFSVDSESPDVVSCDDADRTTSPSHRQIDEVFVAARAKGFDPD